VAPPPIGLGPARRSAHPTSRTMRRGPAAAPSPPVAAPRSTRLVDEEWTTSFAPEPAHKAARRPLDTGEDPWAK
jgi:hypothetical protein